MVEMSELDVDAFRLDHLGIPAQLADNIGFVDAINGLTETDSREILSTGQAVLAMALNCLGFTSRPLYISPQFFVPRNVKFLLGKSKNFPLLALKPVHLNEHRLGRALDRIAEIGPDRIFLEVAIRAFRKEQVKVPMVHEDTTTHSFYGLYLNPNGTPKVGIAGRDEDGTPITVKVTHGYSKDHRDECKQMVQELLVSPDGDVPLMFKAWSGNTNDTIIMRERILELKKALLRAGADDLYPEYFIGDSKLYSQETLEEASKEGTLWITRVPDTVKRGDECVQDAIRGKRFWVKADHISKGLSWQAFTLNHFNVEQRFIVVRTDASIARTDAAVKRRIEKEKQSIVLAYKRLKKKRFSSVTDLKKSWQDLFVRSDYHVAGNLEISEEMKLRSRGRPCKGEESDRFYYIKEGSINKNTANMKKKKLDGACFVIGTNDVRATTRSEDILHYYMKQQQGVERAFRFLKDPEYFADAFFLKKPERIAALLCVMTLALLLFSLSQRKLRQELPLKGLEVEDQKGRKTIRPTMRWVNQHFEGVDVTRISDGIKTVHKFHRLNHFEATVLKALGPDFEKRYTPEFIG